MTLFIKYTQTKDWCEEEFEDNQRGYQNPYIEEEHATQWPKEKVQRTNNDLHSRLPFLVFITFL
jgi:hypothetical protein